MLTCSKCDKDCPYADGVPGKFVCSECQIMKAWAGLGGETNNKKENPLQETIISSDGRRLKVGNIVRRYSQHNSFERFEVEYCGLLFFRVLYDDYSPEYKKSTKPGHYP